MTVSWVAFHLTDRCQLNCDHCLRDPEQKPADLPVELIQRVADEAARLFSIDHAGLTGGEPTLHPHFLQVVDTLVDAGYSWHFVTNGENFGRVFTDLSRRPARLERLTIVNFSLDGGTQKTHDAIRGAGSFESVLRAVSICSAQNIGFRIQCALNARNLDEIETLGMLAASLGAREVAWQVTQPTGTFLDRNLYLEPREWLRARHRIEALQRILTIRVEPLIGFPTDKPFVTCGPWRGEPLHIDVRGRLTMCCLHAGVPATDGSEDNDVAGDLREMPLADAHLRLLANIYEVQRQRALYLAQNSDDPWRNMPCNWCMKAHGRPHWAEAGAAGPQANRERWRGAWEPGYKASHREASEAHKQTESGE